MNNEKAKEKRGKKRSRPEVSPEEMKGSKEAEELIREKAETGDAEAQYALAKIYYRGGESMKKNKQEAARLFELAAKEGHEEALFSLGVMYSKGDGVAKDLGKARELLKKATSEGHQEATFVLGMIYHKGEGVTDEGEKKEGMRLLSLAAEQGHKEAQYTLAIIYETESKDKKGKQVIKLLENAAEKGHKGATVNLALKFLEGEGVEKDEKKAALLLKLAAKAAHEVNEQNHDQLNALYNLALLYFQGRGIDHNPKEALKLLKKASDKGHAESTYTVARYLIDACDEDHHSPVGSKMVEINEERSETEDKRVEGERYLKKAAMQGHHDAIYHVAVMQYFGTLEGDIDMRALEKVSQENHPEASYLLSIIYFDKVRTKLYAETKTTPDSVELKAKALEYLRKSAELGHPAAITRLAVMHKEGEEAEKNVRECVKLLEKAVEKEHGHAMYLLGEMHKEGVNDETGKKLLDADLSKAVSLFIQASQQGHPHAQFELGRLCYDRHQSYGEPEALEEAIKFFREAAEKGHRNAKIHLGMLYHKGKGVQEDKQLAAKLWREAITRTTHE